eukprot:14693659-Alexandrium_andersonii.AAC.1
MSNRSLPLPAVSHSFPLLPPTACIAASNRFPPVSCACPGGCRPRHPPLPALWGLPPPGKKKRPTGASGARR